MFVSWSRLSPSKASAGSSREATAPPYKGPYTSIQETSREIDQEDNDAGVAVMLYPPKERQSLSLWKLWQGLKVWILDRVAPAPDDGSKYEV